MAATRLIKKDGTVIVRVTSLLEEQVYEKLVELKKKSGYSFSAVVRDALEDFWKKQTKKDEILEAFLEE